MKEKLLMIGAGEAQAEGIRRAKLSGFHVIAIDGNPDAPGLALADEGYPIDIKDLTALMQLAIKSKIQFVTSVSCEVCLPIVGALNDGLGLPGISKGIAERMTNKGEMRKLYEKNGIYCPRFYILTDISELATAFEHTGFPCVLKPVDSAGSQGVCYLNSADNSLSAFRDAQAFSKAGQIIIEEFIPGAEISFEGFVIDSELHCLTLSDKIRTPPPHLLDIEVIFPSSITDPLYTEVTTLASKAVKALGINNVPIHMELILSERGPVIVEVAARGPGFRVYTDLIPFVTGVYPLQIQLDLLRGKSTIPKPAIPGRAAVIKFLSGHKGIMKEVAGVPADSPAKHEVRIYKKPGDQVNNLTSGRDRIGHIIVLDENREEAIAIAERIAGQIELKIE